MTNPTDTTPPHAKLSDPLRAPTPEERIHELVAMLRTEAAIHRPNWSCTAGRLDEAADTLRSLHSDLTASLRALEEKNEVLLVAETALHIFIEARKHNGYGMADAEESARTALARIRAAKKDNQKGKQ